MNPLAAPAQQMHVLAPVLLAHHPKAFHFAGITHHFTGTQGEIAIIVVIVLALLGFAAMLRGRTE